MYDIQSRQQTSPKSSVANLLFEEQTTRNGAPPLPRSQSINGSKPLKKMFIHNKIEPGNDQNTDSIAKIKAAADRLKIEVRKKVADVPKNGVAEDEYDERHQRPRHFSPSNRSVSGIRKIETANQSFDKASMYQFDDINLLGLGSVQQTYGNDPMTEYAFSP